MPKPSPGSILKPKQLRALTPSDREMVFGFLKHTVSVHLENLEKGERADLIYQVQSSPGVHPTIYEDCPNWSTQKLRDHQAVMQRVRERSAHAK